MNTQLPKDKEQQNRRSHVYQHIEGWFDFEELYSEMVRKTPADGHFVEVGSFLGKSAAYMAVEICNSGKNIRFDAVDIFNWDVRLTNKIQSPFADTNLVGEIFRRYMEIYKLTGYVNQLEGASVFISKRYKSASLDFVFLDADHRYYAVKNDILAWLPLVKPGGFLGGHDYNEYESPGVIQAVNEVLGRENISLRGSGPNKCWLYQRK